MIKIEEIFRAWGISFNPTEEQNSRAIRRLEICESCEFKVETPIKKCSVCGCWLKKKIFTPIKNGCPKGKWEEVDSDL